MGIQNLVLSIRQMRELNKLGLDVVKTALCWKYNHIIKDYEVIPNRKFERSLKKLREGRITKDLIPIPTLTVQEMLEMLPRAIKDNGTVYFIELHKDWLTWENPEDEDDWLGNACFGGKDFQEMLYNALRFLLENKYLENGKSVF